MIDREIDKIVQKGLNVGDQEPSNSNLDEINEYLKNGLQKASTLHEINPKKKKKSVFFAPKTKRAKSLTKIEERNI